MAFLLIYMINYYKLLIILIDSKHHSGITCKQEVCHSGYRELGNW